MSDNTTGVTQGQLAVSSYLSGMAERGELLPGAKPYLESRFAASKEDGGLANLVDFLASDAIDGGRRYLNPEAPARNEAPLRSHLRRLSPVLQSNEADSIYDDVAMSVDPSELARKPGEVVAGLWERMQTTFEWRDRFRPMHKPSLDHRTRAVLDVLEDLEHHLSPFARNRIERLAHEWREIGGKGKSRGEIARIVAKRLSMPEYAELTATGQPIELEYHEWSDAGRRDPDPLWADLRQKAVDRDFYVM